jgi:hypothetical protein
MTDLVDNLSNIKITDFPPDLKKVLLREECEGFGFQVYGTNPGMIIFAKVFSSVRRERIDPELLAQEIRENTGSRTINIEDWLARNYLEIHYTEWEYIPKVIQWLLNTNLYKIGTHISSGHINVLFKPGDIFSWKEIEFRTISNFKESIKYRDNDWWETFDSMGAPEAWTDYWNWQTPEGKEFCLELRRILGLTTTTESRFTREGYKETCEKYKILHRGVWSGYDPRDHPLQFELQMTTEEFAEVREQFVADLAEGLGVDKNEIHILGVTEDDSILEECMVCMYKKPTTLALPCEHMSVCSDCSERLKDTNDSKVCIRCRQPISMILENGQEPRIIEQ